MKHLRRLRRKTPLKIKLMIAVVSFLFSLGLLEVALRHRGPEANRSERIYRKENINLGPTILCVGDSFTHGGMTGRDETYPHYLEQMLNGADNEEHGSGRVGRNYRVINAGVCAMNTREMWEYLPG
jgi:hypothetical protein